MSNSLIKQRLFIVFIIFFISNCSFLSSEPETYRDLTDTEVKGDKLYISGTLNAQTYDELKGILDSNPQLRTIVLEDIDGSIDDDVNLETGLLIHQEGLNTFVPRHGFIESGAVDLFCAGKERVAQRGAHLGVHAWADASFIGQDMSGHALAKDSPEHDMYLDYFREVGCPESFYWFTLRAAPASGMHKMTEAELVEQGVVTQLVD